MQNRAPKRTACGYEAARKFSQRQRFKPEELVDPVLMPRLKAIKISDRSVAGTHD